jgi:hypothetical protein
MYEYSYTDSTVKPLQEHALSGLCTDDRYTKVSEVSQFRQIHSRTTGSKLSSQHHEHVILWLEHPF